VSGGLDSITKKQEGFHEDHGAEENSTLREEPDHSRREAPKLILRASS
jgi:hypothetical protein